MKKKGINIIILIFILLACVVLGSYVGDALVDLGNKNESFRFLKFLGYSYSFGIDPPFTLDLMAIVLRFGLTLKFSICSIVFIAFGVYIYRKL